MKKILLSLGTVAAVVAPVASVIACGAQTSTGLLDNLKDTYIKTIKDSHLSDAEKDKAIKTIKDGKDTKELIAFMKTMIGPINKANPDGSKPLGTPGELGPKVHLPIGPAHNSGEEFSENPLEGQISWASVNEQKNIIFEVRSEGKQKEEQQKFEWLGTEDSLSKVLRAIKGFNQTDVAIDKSFNATGVNADLINNIKGKELRAELYYRESANKYFYIAKVDDLKNPPTVFKLDTKESGNTIEIGSFGIALFNDSIF